jgi:D-psicose/D-tagatose/L-ribulose 3-epimerase
MTFGKNKIGLHAFCWVGGWSEEEARKAISGTAKLGYDLIEIPALDPSRIDVAMTKRLLTEYQLGSTMSLGLGPDMDISGDDAVAAQRGQDQLMRVVEIAQEIGATNIGGIIYSAFQKYAHPPTQAGVERSAAILNRVCAAAAPSEIIIGLEVVNRYESNICNTAAQGVALCNLIDAPNVKVHLDTYHMNIEEGDGEQAIVETGDQLGYMHLGECHRGYLGSGSIDFASYFRGLAQIDYSGPIVFESFSSKVVDAQLTSILAIWRNLWSDSEDLSAHAKLYIDTLMRSAVAGERLSGRHMTQVLQES